MGFKRWRLVISSQVESDGPSGEECTVIGGARGEKDMAAASPSEVVVDVREVKQGDYVRVTLRFDKKTYTKIINIDTNITKVTVKDVTQMCFRSSKKIMGFLLLAYGRNQSESRFFQQIIR